MTQGSSPQHLEPDPHLSKTMEHDRPSVKEEGRPHGCLTAFLIFVILSAVGAAGFVLLTTLAVRVFDANAQVQVVGIATALYALGTLIPFGLTALLLRDKRFGLWRGTALALALTGGHTTLVGCLLIIDLALPWPGLPTALPSIISGLYGLAIIAAGRKRFSGRPSGGALLMGLATGTLVSVAWVVVGALGTLSETLNALIDALSSGLISTVLIASLFFYDEEMPVHHPFWSAVLVGAAFLALQPGLLALRGFWMQGHMLSWAIIPIGFIAGALLTLDEHPEPRRLWWATLVFFFLVFLLPYAWTDGLEGDLMIEDMPAAWFPAVGVSVLSAGFLGLLMLGLRRWLVKLTHAPIIPGGFYLGSLALAAILYASIGQPGLQPDTFFVVMKEQADTTFAREIDDRTERVIAVYETLTDHALSTQADLRAFLDKQGVRYTPYYLVNGIEVEGNPLLRFQIAARPDVDRILDSPHTRPLPPFARPSGEHPLSRDTLGDSLTWGVDQMDAEIVWEEYSITGEGIIVGSADSGVDWRHPALRSQYLGTEGAHDYTWFDPWYGTTEPTDTSGHGTHTVGTILGQGGIGVAPGAQWIACRNLGRNLGNPTYYLDCMQFLFAPHPQDGDPFREGDPTRGAHVTNNSWGCPPQEGCDNRTLTIGIEHLRNAGQMMVIGAGNDGPKCSTIWSPASAEAAFSVGATDASGDIALFSSRGPVLVDGTGRIEPDVVAPGVNIISSVPGGGYAANSGTSMAGPHVTGLVALLWSANPNLIGNIDITEQIITSTARYKAAAALCGGGDGEHNNTYGHGFIDALKAVERAMELP